MRDASGQLIGLLQLGEAHYAAVGRALRFMLASLQAAYQPGSYRSYAPHVMTADKTLRKIVGFDSVDQTDDTFYLIAAWGRYVQLAGDAALQADFYGLLRNYSLHYLAAGARSLGEGGTPAAPAYGGACSTGMRASACSGTQTSSTAGSARSGLATTS